MTKSKPPIFSKIEDIPDWDREQIPEPCHFRDSQGNVYPALKVNNWNDFLALMKEDLFKGNNYIFRGQKKAEWLLESSLSRINQNCLIDDKVVQEQLNNYKNLVQQEGLTFTDVQLWAIGQHHGLHTPYLDWTQSHIVALYFAFQEIDRHSKYRSVCILDVHKSIKHNGDRIKFVHYKDVAPNEHELFRRFICQEGCFTKTDDYSPIEKIVAEQGITSNYFCKVFIKNADRAPCLELLKSLDYSHNYIYPDFHGIALECNEVIYKKRKSAFPGGPIIPILQKLVDPIQIQDLASKLKDASNNSKNIDFKNIATKVFKLRFDLKDILIKEGFPYNKIDAFIDEYLNLN